MSLEKFASAIGMGRSTLVRIENGSREPDEAEYAAMARESGLPLGFFLVRGMPSRPVRAGRWDVITEAGRRTEPLERREPRRQGGDGAQWDCL